MTTDYTQPIYTDAILERFVREGLAARTELERRREERRVREFVEHAWAVNAETAQSAVRHMADARLAECKRQDLMGRAEKLAKAQASVDAHVKRCQGWDPSASCFKGTA